MLGAAASNDSVNGLKKKLQFANVIVDALFDRPFLLKLNTESSHRTAPLDALSTRIKI